VVFVADENRVENQQGERKRKDYVELPVLITWFGPGAETPLIFTLRLSYKYQCVRQFFFFALSFPIPFFCHRLYLGTSSDTNYTERPLTMTAKVSLLFSILSTSLLLC
jgi:hypothetical protein